MIILHYFSNHSDSSFITINEDDSQRQFSLKKIGVCKSRGFSDGRSVYKGPRGGLFYLGINGWKSYIRSCSVVYD